MFPLTIEGWVARDDRADVEVIAQRICAEIKKFGFEGAIQGATVSFVNNKNILYQMFKFDRSSQYVDDGAFRIEDEAIRYRLSVTTAVLLYSTILLLPLVLAIVLGSVVGAFAIIALWVLNIGLGYWVIAVRVRRAVQRVTSPSA